MNDPDRQLADANDLLQMSNYLRMSQLELQRAKTPEARFLVGRIERLLADYTRRLTRYVEPSRA